MNATVPTKLCVISYVAHSATVRPYGFDMDCEFEYEPGEAAIHWPTDSAHPGSPANAQLISCKVGGVDIADMLTLEQRESIEEALISAMEE